MSKQRSLFLKQLSTKALFDDWYYDLPDEKEQARLLRRLRPELFDVDETEADKIWIEKVSRGKF